MIRPAMMHSAEFWAIKRQHIQKTSVLFWRLKKTYCRFCSLCSFRIENPMAQGAVSEVEM
jgi:hypothetical protein